MKKTIFTLVCLFTCWLLPADSHAIPNLQIYSPEEGTYYDTDSETWIIPHYSYELWVIGAEREVVDVKLGLAVPEDEDGTITIDHTVLSEDLEVDYPGPYDGTAPFFVAHGTPLMGDGDPVPGGGIFPCSYYQYYLGDFGLDEEVHNYIPGDEYMDTALGHTERLQVEVSGYSWVNIIAYDHVVLGHNKAKYVKTPYSHDGGGGCPTPVPEPATLVLLAGGLAALKAGSRWKGQERP